MTFLYEVNILVHIAFALVCLILGAYLLIETKGDFKHKKLGKIYIALFLVVLLSSIFIKELNHGSFSWLHLLTLFTFFAIIYALVMIKLKKISTHMRTMFFIYLGLFIAGILSITMSGRFLTS